MCTESGEQDREGEWNRDRVGEGGDGLRIRKYMAAEGGGGWYTACHDRKQRMNVKWYKSLTKREETERERVRRRKKTDWRQKNRSVALLQLRRHLVSKTIMPNLFVCRLFVIGLSIRSILKCFKSSCPSLISFIPLFVLLYHEMGFCLASCLSPHAQE